MSGHIGLVSRGAPVAPLLWALREHPELWNEYPARTASPASPHHQVDDIWVRYAPWEQAHLDGPHDSVWYPAAEVLPNVKTVCRDIMGIVGGDRLGGVLITRVPAGKQVLPHVDDKWHARYYQKYALQLDSAPGQAFCFEDGRLETQPGDLYWFDNSAVHWVENPTPYDRVTMIVCARKD